MNLKDEPKLTGILGQSSPKMDLRKCVDIAEKALLFPTRLPRANPVEGFAGSLYIGMLRGADWCCI